MKSNKRRPILLVIALFLLVLIVVGQYFKVFGIMRVDGQTRFFLGKDDYYQTRIDILKEGIFEKYQGGDTPKGKRKSYFNFLADSIENAYAGLDYAERTFGFSWEEVVDYYRPLVNQVENDDGFNFLCEEMISLLDNNGHTNIISRENSDYNKVLPLGIKKSGDKFLLTGYNRGLRDEKEYTDLMDLGDQVVSIDGVKMSEIYNELAARTIYGKIDKTEYLLMKRFFQSYYYYFKRLDKDNSYLSRVVFKKADGSRYNLLFKWGTGYYGIKGVKMFVTRKPIVLSRIYEEGNIGYIKVNSFDPDFIDDFNKAYQKVKDTNGLIIDLRNNYGGDYTNYGQEILSKFISKKEVTAYKKFKNSRLLHIYGYGALAYPGNSHFQGEYYAPIPIECEPDDELYQKPVVLLTNRYHYSSADMFITAFHDLEIGKIVGRLGQVGSFGQPIRFNNPWNDWRTTISVVEKLSSKKKLAREMNIKPDIYVPLIEAEILRKEDPILEAGLKELRE